MAGISEVISTYILAKGCNRPWLMRRVFAESAPFRMVVRTGAISFPPDVVGIDAVTETLIRRFALENENVYAFCLKTAPEGSARQFSCDWLVGMSRRDTGQVRVGCGRYDWVFQDRPEYLASSLKITIGSMEVVGRDHLRPVMGWLNGLAIRGAPPA